MTSWLVSQETDAEKFAQALMDGLAELGRLLDTMATKTAKL